MDTPHCLHCQRDDGQTPLIAFTFQNETYWICPGHLPILIHKPEQLESKLPGITASSTGAEHDHHHE